MHLPGQTEPVSFGEPLNALVLHNLTLQWSQGRLLEPSALATRGILRSESSVADGSQQFTGPASFTMHQGRGG